MGHHENKNISEWLDHEYLTEDGNTFCECVHDLRKVLKSIKKEHILDAPVPDESYSPLGDDEYEVLVLMQACMDS